jgi:hypothetical protein
VNAFFSSAITSNDSQSVMAFFSGYGFGFEVMKKLAASLPLSPGAAEL